MSSGSLRWLPILAWALALPAAAQDTKYPGNLDVPFVPTNQATVEAMLRIAGVGPNDFLIDLGSGDGRILITAAKKYGARGFGVDLDPQRVKESTAYAREAGVAERAQFYQRNLFDTRISEATVLTMYLLPRVNLALRSRLFAELKPGTRVVSHDFDMGDWKADLQASVRGAGSQIYFWVIPAQVGGLWKLQVGSERGTQEYELDITQKYQEINVVARRAGKQVVVISPRLDGDTIAFVLVDHDDPVYRRRFDGKVAGNTIEGNARGEANALRGEYKWRATK
ncbi:MAG TPA: SAM-dependent methyltransferase [Burkholderiales bacterium]|nr:SAM-dependent methyltransferase [Burkholderiales bacterium]